MDSRSGSPDLDAVPCMMAVISRYEVYRCTVDIGVLRESQWVALPSLKVPSWILTRIYGNHGRMSTLIRDTVQITCSYGISLVISR